MTILRSEAREIGGRAFTIRMLPLADSLKVYGRLQRLLAVWADDDARETGLGPIMLSGMVGGVNGDDLNLLAETFGKTTTVDVGEGRTITLTGEKERMEVFGGRVEDLFTWLDECVALNFEGVIAKLRAAAERASAAAKAAEAQKAEQQ